MPAAEAALPLQLPEQQSNPSTNPISEKLSTLLTKLHLKHKTEPEDALAEIAQLGVQKSEAAPANIQAVTDIVENTSLFRKCHAKMDHIITHIKENPLELAGTLIPISLGAAAIVGNTSINPDMLDSLPPALLGRLALVTGAGFISADRTKGSVKRKIAAGVAGAAGGVIASELLERFAPGGEHINTGISFTDEPATIGALVINARRKRKMQLNTAENATPKLRKKSDILAPRGRTLIQTSLKPR
ncbi:hypothetical protein HY024_02310 [Candidatus Curtissbacteria bacterium]|nr:hypothetical protein [Candidatus Curtissbacteria bacterium]